MSFIRNARVMLVGFAVAQAAPLVASPILARLYSPEAFGLQTLFISVAGVLTVLATLRLDLAVVLAEDEREAREITALGLAQTLIVATLTGLGALLLSPLVADFMGRPGQTGWLWALAPMVAALAVTQIFSGVLTWSRRFGPASFAQVGNQFSYLATAIGLGLTTSPTQGMVAAKTIGQGMAATGLWIVLRRFLATIHLPAHERRHGLWTRCRPFLVFNTPYSLIGVLGREVPIFAFSAVAATATVGFYGLARTLLGAPATLLSASLSQVVYREAVEHRGAERLESLVVVLLRLTLTATAPFFAFLIIWGDQAFAMVFGEAWRTAGLYAMILAPASWLTIQTAWPERLYESVGRQGVSFVIQVGFDALTAAAVFAAIFMGAPHAVCIALFVTVNCTFHLVYLAGMFHVAGLSLPHLLRTLAWGAAVMACSILTMLAVRLAGMDAAMAMFGCGAAAGMIACGIGLDGLRRLKALPS